MNSPPDDPHYHCEPPWECLGCGRDVCPRCEPSPAEEELCADCYWIAGPNPNGSAA
jgi:hypothetical protein